MPGSSATIHIDGGSRGNPGPASYAVVLQRPGLDPVEIWDILGVKTNNVAEYTALLKAFELAESLGLQELLIHSDSELLVKQMNGQYKVKSEDLRELYDRATQLRTHFTKVTITHVRREMNKRADQLCNLALDGKTSPRPVAADTTETEEDQLDTAGKALLASFADLWSSADRNRLTVDQAWLEIRKLFQK